jgi:hypothetical protein
MGASALVRCATAGSNEPAACIESCDSTSAVPSGLSVLFLFPALASLRAGLFSVAPAALGARDGRATSFDASDASPEGLCKISDFSVRVRLFVVIPCTVLLVGWDSLHGIASGRPFSGIPV